MVVIPTKDWTEFVAEVRSRLDVIDANIANARTINDVQHKQLQSDFLELKEQLTSKDPTSIENRVRSLEDSRTKMNGIQMGISFAFSAFSAALAWLLGHPNLHLTMHDASTKIETLMATIMGFFGRRT